MVRQYAQAAKYAGDYDGPGLFGDLPEPEKPHEAFNRAFGTDLKQSSAPVEAIEQPTAPKPSADFAEAFARPKAPAPAPARVPGIPAGREAMNALGAGRKATAAKYDAQGVLKSLPNSGEYGRQVFDSALQAKDSTVERLREIQRVAPDQIPKLSRAYLEDLFTKATSEGGFTRAKGIQQQWLNLGKETKEILFPNPKMRQDLDSFFRLARMSAENPNPSGTAVLGASSTLGTLAVMHPGTGVPVNLAAGVVSKLLHSPAGVEALTNGLRVPVANKAAAAFAANRILKLAAEASKTPAPAYQQAAQVSPAQTERPALIASR
jgi:hypothetical protein